LKYVQVIQCAAEGDGIRVDMMGEDQREHRFDVSAQCAGVLAASLATEAEKFNTEDGNRQFIRPTGMQTGRTADGEPMLFLSIAGGAELPFVFKPESLGVIISELEALRQGVQPDPQIRWR